MPTLDAEIQTWPIEGEFVIARGAKREAAVVLVRISDGEHVGRGECVPYGRYDETTDGVLADILAAKPAIEANPTRTALQSVMPQGAARNAVDCALWDLEAKIRGVRATELAGEPAFVPTLSAYTISLGPAEEMAARAKWAASFPLLKLKLGGEGDEDRLKAVRAAVPDARLTVDANEAWTPDTLAARLALSAELGIELVEQPLPASNDGALADVARPVPVCADEALHTAADVAGLTDRYDVVNIKLDKAGGLTEALHLADEAKRHGLGIMVGCMVGTSLGMAPALVLAARATWVDLDGPLLLANDRHPALRYENATIQPPEPALWG